MTKKKSNVYRNFKSVADFISTNRAKPCRMKCGKCEKTWKQTATTAVNMLFKGAKTFYVCDSCADKNEIK